MLGSAFAAHAPDTIETYPRELRPEIDAWNERIHRHLNNGVYRAGFATTQSAYDEAVVGVFDTLGAIDDSLAHSAYLCGDTPTEADWRLLPTLVRFDVGYFSAFKCNLRRVGDYPRIPGYLRRLLADTEVRETVHLDVYRRGYHSRSDARNPHGIVPVGPLDVLWRA